MITTKRERRSTIFTASIICRPPEPCSARSRCHRCAVAARGWRDRAAGLVAARPRGAEGARCASTARHARVAAAAAAGGARPRRADAAAQQHRRMTRLPGAGWPSTPCFWTTGSMATAGPAFFVVTPLRLADGSAVLVQRGWAPRDVLDRDAAADACATPDGEVEIAGRIAPPPARLFEFEPARSGPIRQNLDLGRIRARDRRAPAAAVGAADRSDGATTACARRLAASAGGRHKHHGYAFQWFALCRADRRSVCLVPTRPAPTRAGAAEPLAFTVHSAAGAGAADRRARTAAGPAEDAAGAAGLRRAGAGVVLHLLRDPARGPQPTTRR